MSSTIQGISSRHLYMRWYKISFIELFEFIQRHRDVALRHAIKEKKNPHLGQKIEKVLVVQR